MMKEQVSHERMLINGEWIDRNDKIQVYDPQDNRLIATVPAASKADVKTLFEGAKEGIEIAEKLTVHQRISILARAADLLKERIEDFAYTISKEGSKTITEARKEVYRCSETLQISAEEARRISGETIPFDQVPGNSNRVGYFYRFPIGLILAITPFNDPLNLVAHKLGPAIASGNAIIIKPASVTPLSALKLAALMEEAGLPKKIISVITGKGGEIGDLLLRNPLVRMVSFTGGVETGQQIANVSGIKKLGMELGSNSPVIILKDADIYDAAVSTVSGAFSAAGQNCIGVQRIYIENEIYEKFTAEFVEQTRRYRTGDKQSELTDMGPMITESEARRVEGWVNDARKEGAKVLTGGHRKGAFFEPTVLVDVPESCKLAYEEVFGPVVLFYRVKNLDEAIQRANAVKYGLQAGIFTKNLDYAFKAVHQINAGGVMVNDSSDFRIDDMPFGGIKDSGLGREGIRYVIQEMTEQKVICFKLSNES